MKISIFPNYGALNSKEVFDAFKMGAELLGHTVVEHDMSADLFVIWSVLWNGRMSSNKHVWDTAKKENKKILVIEIGGLHRGTTWRIGLNHINGLGQFGNNDNFITNRAQQLNVSLAPWKHTGTAILICGQHTKSEQWQLRPEPNEWLSSLVTNIRAFSDRPIIFRPHPRDVAWYKENKEVILHIPKKIDNTYDSFNHEDDFKNAWCVINPCSNTGLLAAINGIPIFVDKDSLAYPVSNVDFSTLEQPITPDRNSWFEKIIHTEWTIDEIKLGTPFKRIYEQHLTL